VAVDARLAAQDARRHDDMRVSGGRCRHAGSTVEKLMVNSSRKPGLRTGFPRVKTQHPGPGSYFSDAATDRTLSDLILTCLGP
jgi:hypothetical protein